MEDIGDDFGDLYADVELPASTSINVISNFDGLYTEQDDNKTECIDSGPKNVDELIQDDEGKRDASAEANGERVVGVDNGSDSEDDLNIVLNDDDDGSVFPVALGVNSRSGGFDEDEEEDGRFEVVAEGDGLSKNRKCVDQSILGDGLELSPSGGPVVVAAREGIEQRAVINHSICTTRLVEKIVSGETAFDKYIRPGAASFPSNSKPNGSVGVASFSSKSVRGDGYGNECNQRTATSSLVAQSGHNFSLPQYRAILDINIDTFEWKPSRHPGTDATDFLILVLMKKVGSVIATAWSNFNNEHPC